MARVMSLLGVLTIPISTKPSNLLKLTGLLGAEYLVFVTPAAFTGAVSVEGNYDGTDTTLPLKLEGTDLTITAGRIHAWRFPGLKALRINSASNEAAARAVSVYVQVEP